MGFTAKDTIIGLILFAVIFTGTSLFYFDLGAAYDSAPDTNETAIYELVNGTLSTGRGLGGDAEKAVQEQDSRVGENILAGKSVIAAMKLPLVALKTILFKLVPAFTKELGIPNWFVIAIEAILLATVGFMIIRVFFRTEV